ncbi:hypothetical protein J4216_00475 [Candidatus Woesearchaeota archaeon]|nr:hypothetical protein [Candidatus Woesearchaeota archaeon]
MDYEKLIYNSLTAVAIVGIGFKTEIKDYLLSSTSVTANEIGTYAAYIFLGTLPLKAWHYVRTRFSSLENRVNELEKRFSKE